jgi:mRNA interferase YafQ
VNGRADREVRRTSTFKSDLKRAMSHRKCDMKSLLFAMRALVARHPLPPSMLDHPLRGRYPPGKDGKTECRECHTSNDWLLVYRFPDDDSIHFIRTGTHSDLF